MKHTKNLANHSDNHTASLLKRSALKRGCVVWLAAVLLLAAMTGCTRKSPVAGRWQLVSSQDEGYLPGMIFDFRTDGTLVIGAGTAPLSTEDLQALGKLQNSTPLTYATGMNSEMKLTLRRENNGPFSLSMHFKLEGDRLILTDDDGIQLVFQKAG